MRMPVIWAAIAVGCHIGLAAQQVPTFRSRVDLVELDVSVLDEHRRPVRGLTRGDFTVLEDGTAQEVALFEAIDVPDPVAPPAAWMRDVTPDVDTNETRVTRLWAIVLDDALIPLHPYAIKTSVMAARQVIDQLGPQDLAALIFTTDSRKAQDFTNDRTKLLATLEQFHPGWASWRPPPQGVRINVDAQFHTGSVLTLRNTLEILSEQPHHRKAVVWISPGFGLFHFDESTIADALSSNRMLEVGLDVMKLARVVNVPIYGVSPCGLLPVEMPRAASVDTCVTATSGGRATLFGLSTSSGGRPLMDTNDVDTEIPSIFVENSSYYMLGYYPTNARTDGRLRRIEVKTPRDGARVRTRSSYTAPRRPAEPAKSVNEALGRVTAAPIPLAEMPMRATAAPFALPGNARMASVAVALGIREPVPAKAGADRVEVVTELRIGAYTTEGDDKATQRSTARVLLRPGADGDAEYEALSRINLPPGRFRLRIAAHNSVAAKVGSVTVDVIVPDFAREPASLSGVVLGVTPGRPSAPRDLFAPAMPVVPTTQREFGAGDRATAFFEVYQRAGTPVDAALNVRIVDGLDRVALTDTVAIAAGQFTPARTLATAPVRYDVPVDRLAPGRYLLTLEVNILGQALRRDVQFTVK